METLRIFTYFVRICIFLAHIQYTYYICPEKIIRKLDFIPTKPKPLSNTFYSSMQKERTLNYTYKIFLNLVIPGGGAWEAHFSLFHEKSPHFAVYFIQIYTKTTPPQTLGLCSNASTIIWLFQIFEKFSQKRSYLIDGPLRPPLVSNWSFLQLVTNEQGYCFTFNNVDITLTQSEGPTNVSFQIKSANWKYLENRMLTPTYVC